MEDGLFPGITAIRVPAGGKPLSRAVSEQPEVLDRGSPAFPEFVDALKWSGVPIAPLNPGALSDLYPPPPIRHPLRKRQLLCLYAAPSATPKDRKDMVLRH